MKGEGITFGLIFLLIFSSIGSISIKSRNEMGEIENTITNPIGSTINHIWPMYRYDAQHTGRSPYDTSDNPGYERWKYFVDAPITSTAAIDNEGTLYLSTNSLQEQLHAVYPNGINKWIAETSGWSNENPAIGNDGDIYVGSVNQFHAIYKNGTTKWIFDDGNGFNGYPVVDPNGIIYAGVGGYGYGKLFAFFPTNGTVKWAYEVGGAVRAPAIDIDGDIYFTSLDRHLYCLSQNGSFKWKFNANSSFDIGPVVDFDGTVYLAPRTDWLIAVNPDGTEKWRTDITDFNGHPAIAPDGTIIYTGLVEDTIALNPDNGEILWTYTVRDAEGYISSSVIGNDGTIYFAYPEYVCALYPDGRLKWKNHLTSDIYPYDAMFVLGDPSIGEDGTVYVTSWYQRGGTGLTAWGYIHAIGALDPNAPEAPTIEGDFRGKVGVEYEYTFQTTSPIGNDVYYFINWDDDCVENWIGPYPSSEEITLSHTWEKWGIYNIQVRAKDTDNLWGPWSELKVIMPVNQQSSNSFFVRFLDRFPNAFPTIRHLSGL